MGTGEVRLRGNIWWIRYYIKGKRYEKSSGSTKKSDAVTLLQTYGGTIAKGVPVTPKMGPVVRGGRGRLGQRYR